MQSKHHTDLSVHIEYDDLSIVEEDEELPVKKIDEDLPIDYKLLQQSNEE